MRETGKVTLLIVDERMVYYVKGSAKEIPAHRAGHTTSFATMDVKVTHVLSDLPGAGEEGARITSGVTFFLPSSH